MAEEENSFLKTQGHSQVLQQKMQDLYSAFSRFFKGKGGYPQFKTKNGYNSIRFPQGINLDEKNQRIFLPKTGFVRYRKSRDIEGDIKNVTVSFFSGEWYVSIQTQKEIEVPEINLKTMLETEADNALGIDMGAVRFCTFSDGRYEESLKSNELTRLDEKIAIAQRQLKNKKKGSNRRLRLIKRISRLHQKKANIRNDSHQKLSTLICNSHAIVVAEELKIKNMTKSAKGSLLNPGKNVKAKSGLNRSILSEGWGQFFKMLEYRDLIPCCTGMIQKEVAERLVARPGTKAYGILSVLVQAWYSVEYLFTVEPNVFNPPPKVRSAVVRMTRNGVTELGCDPHLFRRVVKTTFNQRRKTLRNNLRPLLSELDIASGHSTSVSDHTAFLSDALFDLRPERLSVGQFVELTNAVQAECL